MSATAPPPSAPAPPPPLTTDDEREAITYYQQQEEGEPAQAPLQWSLVRRIFAYTRPYRSLPRAAQLAFRLDAIAGRAIAGHGLDDRPDH